MKCFLHIGTEKTATTTIQNFLHLNRENLLSKGFIYPESVGKKNNRALSIAAYNSGRRDNLTKLKQLDSDDKLLEFQEQTVQKLRQEVSNVETASTIIFSSEFFQSRLTKISEIERLKEILKGLGVTDISVIVYLRRPADIANSLYSTAIRNGSILECHLFSSSTLRLYQSKSIDKDKTLILL